MTSETGLAPGFPIYTDFQTGSVGTYVYHLHSFVDHGLGFLEAEDKQKTLSDYEKHFLSIPVYFLWQEAPATQRHTSFLPDHGSCWSFP